MGKVRVGGEGNDGQCVVGRGWQQGWGWLGCGSICGDQLEEKQRPTRSRSTSGWQIWRGVSLDTGGGNAQLPPSQALCLG